VGDLLKKLLKRIGINGAIAYTILSRVIQAGGGIIALFFIARNLSVYEQGYYYTFASLIGIQVFFELGLSTIITQYTAHEFAHLSMPDGKTLIGDDYYKSRLGSLLQFCVKWFGIISIILLAALIAVGFLFFLYFNKNSADIEWQKPWVILCLSTALNLFIDPLLAFYDGLGEVKDMAKVRLIQKLSNLVFLILFFSLGFKLYSSALASLLSIIINYLQVVFSRRKDILLLIWKQKTEWKIDYFKEIFPYQWRIAVSWISGYFIYQFFNPVLFATEGAVVAGQMGLTIQILNGVNAIVMSWVTTKIPLFSNLVSVKNYAELDYTFNSTLKRVSVLYIGFLIGFIMCVWLLKQFQLPYFNRFLPLMPTVMMSVIFFMNQIIFSWATYIRCHKVEPYLMFSIISAVLTSLSTVFLGKYFGLNGIVTGYFFITIASFILSYSIFKKNKTLLHAVSAV
jgi:O-antigen/teichoic acid export membrane protein